MARIEYVIVAICSLATVHDQSSSFLNMPPPRSTQGNSGDTGLARLADEGGWTPTICIKRSNAAVPFGRRHHFRNQFDACRFMAISLGQQSTRHLDSSQVACCPLWIILNGGMPDQTTLLMDAELF
ncbi:MAG: hypothetical protein WA842_07465 [Croceibacterium sp.]